MHGPIPGVAMIFHVIGKLVLEKSIHGLARYNFRAETRKGLTSERRRGGLLRWR
jgi:hypothetical protein